VIVGNLQEEATLVLLEVVNKHYLFSMMLVAAHPDQVDGLSQLIPLLPGCI
jgi:hypothetical protein